MRRRYKAIPFRVAIVSLWRRFLEGGYLLQPLAPRDKYATKIEPIVRTNILAIIDYLNRIQEK
jgi:hypothetical protein